MMRWRRGNKYQARACLYDGGRFASRKELRRYQELQLLERAGAIGALERQPCFLMEILAPSGEMIPVGRFTADFRYRLLNSGDETMVIEDVKGGSATKTEAYRLRKRIVEAQYGLVIQEV